MAALMQGQSIRYVSRAYDVPKTTVASWGKELAGLTGGVPPVPDKKKEEIENLLIDLLIAKLKSQIAIAEHSGDKKWLNTQDASAVALLAGVNDDKLIRLIEKFENGQPSSDSAEN
jgi:hypothetical protein